MTSLPLMADDSGNAMWVVIGVVLGLVGLVLVLIVFKYANLYVRCLTSGAGINLPQLFLMSLRKIRPETIVDSRISAVQANVDANFEDLQAHYLAGGNVFNVVRAMIAADRAGIDLSFSVAAGIDLAGRNVLDAVQTCVNPKIIDCPKPEGGKSEIAAVAKDGIQLLAKARVTVRTNLARLIGGATEDTIIARVGEGIVTSIGSAATYKDVLEKGLDAGTAFEILSIDIADVDVGANVGAKLQTDQAEADKRVAQAHAEVRRAMAVAQEQEMQAKVMENRAKLVEAEAQVPLAMSDALREGRLGVMDYMRLQNIQADTGMRDSLGGGGPSSPRPKD